LWDSGDNVLSQIGFTFKATKKVKWRKQTDIALFTVMLNNCHCFHCVVIVKLKWWVMLDLFKSRNFLILFERLAAQSLGVIVSK
jgi:hypothetical protein